VSFRTRMLLAASPLVLALAVFAAVAAHSAASLAAAAWIAAAAIATIALGLGSIGRIASGRGELAVRAHAHRGAEVHDLAARFHRMAERTEHERRPAHLLAVVLQMAPPPRGGRARSAELYASAIHETVSR